MFPLCPHCVQNLRLLGGHVGVWVVVALATVGVGFVLPRVLATNWPKTPTAAQPKETMSYAPERMPPCDD
jgi:hypothetical protein